MGDTVSLSEARLAPRRPYARPGVEDDVTTLYTTLIGALDALGLAYIHTLDTADDDLFAQLRKLWHGAYVVNPSPGIVGEQADQARGEHWLGQGADLIAYARAYLANPDLVERFRTGKALRVADPSAYYQGGDAGYIDYVGHQH